MTPRPDDGEIVCQKRIAIDKEDTAKTLHEKAAHATLKMLNEILPQIVDGSALRQPQDPSKASYYGGRGPADGEIDWFGSSEQVRNLVRAVTDPFPGAFTHVGNRKCLIWSVSEADDVATARRPGEILSVDPFVIACRKGAVRVNFGQREGGIYMSGSQLASELNLVEGIVSVLV